MLIPPSPHLPRRTTASSGMFKAMVAGILESLLENCVSHLGPVGAFQLAAFLPLTVAATALNSGPKAGSFNEEVGRLSSCLSVGKESQK